MEGVMTTGEKVDRLCTDVAVLCSQVGEMSKRLDEHNGYIKTLNHNSTETQISLAKIETALGL